VLSWVVNEKKINKSTHHFIENEYRDCEDDLKYQLLQIMTKFDYINTKPHLF